MRAVVRRVGSGDGAPVTDAAAAATSGQCWRFLTYNHYMRARLALEWDHR